MKKGASSYHPITIGPLHIPGNVFFAPMAGFSDRPYREICARLGAPFAYTEMVSCDGLCFGSKKTEQLMASAPSEKLFGIQLFTSSAEMAAKAIEHTVPFGPSLIDLNCGCPVPKVVGPGAGAALMREPQKIAGIVSALKEGCSQAGLSIPITVKLRSGWTYDEITHLDAANAAVDAGASAVALHPRTRSQGYSGTADWTLIAALKKSISVPIIGSGDLNTPQDIEKMLTETGCDAVMVARGAIGNPFIFRRTKEYLTSGIMPEEPKVSERIAVALEHLRTAIEMLGEERAAKELRKHVCAYTKGLSGSAKLRAHIVKAITYADYEDCMESYLSVINTPHLEGEV